MNTTFVTVAQYAELCGVSKTVIRNRIGQKRIKTQVINGATVIDTVKYPPHGPVSKGRPRHDNLLAKAKVMDLE